MKVSELDNLFESVISKEIKAAIMEQLEDVKHEVYHVKCEGEPVETCNSEDEAQEIVNKLEKEHPGKQFIIEKGKYDSYDHMIDKLDEMGEQLEEKEKHNMETSAPKIKSFAHAISHAKDKGLKKVKINGEIHNVDECWKRLEEEEGSDCADCHGPMNEQHYNEDGYETKGDQDESVDFEKILRGSKHGNDSQMDEIIDLNKLSDQDIEEGDGYHLTSESKRQCDECGTGLVMEDNICNECGSFHQPLEEGACPKCGKKACECGMNESKKKVLRLKEDELIGLIKTMVKESIPGLDAYGKAHKESGKQNNKEVADMMADVTKNHINIPGLEKADFPNANTKGDKVARKNTKDDEETIDDNRGRNPFDLTYDIEPSQQFKDRLKKAIEGHSSMGNAPTTEPAKIKPSNGADKGKEAEEKEGNQMKTDTGKKFEKEAKRRIEIKKKEPRYAKEATPVKSMNESKTFAMADILNNEIKKMKNLTSYNKKTQ
jgi:hypothetical protein